MGLKEIDSIALQQSLRNMEQAYQNFFRGSGFPKFKKKHDNYHSYRTQNQGNNIRIEGNRLKLSKIGKVKFANSRQFSGKIINAISRTPSGKYFVSVLVDELENIKAYRTLEKKLARTQKELSRKQKGPKNRNKARIKVARIHEKIVNIRRDYLQKNSTKLIHENQVICLEDLAVCNMLRNHKLVYS